MTQRIALGLFILAACGGGKNDVDPRVVPGGGVGDGAINGELNVYVIDEITDEPVAGATVSVGEPGAEPLEGVTDSTGLFTFDGDLEGPQTITAVASGYAVATWFGANGANVTIPLSPETEPPVAQAQLSGTIAGWDTLAPATDHAYIALVQYSQTTDLGDPANNLPQGGGTGLPANACINSTFATMCDWVLNTRTGQVDIYAIIIDVDTNGTPTDDTDDTWTVVGMAYDLGLTVEDGVDQSNISLVQADEGTMATADLTLAASPSGLTSTFGLVGVDMGATGTWMFPVITDQNIAMMVPNLEGDFAGATYRALAATSDGAEDGAQTVILHRGLTDVSAHDMGAWLPLAGDPAVASGTYSYSPVDGASMHVVDLEAAGESLWNLAMLDGRTEFTLPAVDPSPLPGGAIDMRVSAIEVPDFDAGDFELDALLDQVTRISANLGAVTP